MDGAIWGDVYNSHGNAVASVGFERLSGDIQTVANNSIIRGIVIPKDGYMIPSKGAAPISWDGVLVSACGVGRGTCQEDED